VCFHGDTTCMLMLMFAVLEQKREHENRNILL
jgi:hypothetical protein